MKHLIAFLLVTVFLATILLPMVVSLSASVVNALHAGTFILIVPLAITSLAYMTTGP